MVELPQEVGDGAIRMIAFGVLEYDIVQNRDHFNDTIGQVIDRANAQREVLHLVCSEVNARGWKLSMIAGRNGKQFILLGVKSGSAALPTRPKIAQGTLQEVCRVAVDWLDKGPQPTPRPVR